MINPYKKEQLVACIGTSGIVARGVPEIVSGRGGIGMIPSFSSHHVTLTQPASEGDNYFIPAKDFYISGEQVEDLYEFLGKVIQRSKEVRGVQ